MNLATLHILEEEARHGQALRQTAAYFEAALALCRRAPSVGLMGAPAGAAPSLAALFFEFANAEPAPWLPLGTFATQPPTPAPPSAPAVRYLAPVPIATPIDEPVPPPTVGQLSPLEFEEFASTAGTRWDEPTPCPLCARECPSKYQAKKHYMRTHYAGIRRHRCTRCGVKAYAMREDLTTHLKSCGVVYPCETCGAKLGSRETLVRHCRRTSHALPPKPARASPAAVTRATTSTPARDASSVVEVPAAGPLARTGLGADASVGAALLCDGAPAHAARTADESHGALPSTADGAEADDEDGHDDEDGFWASLEESLFCFSR